MSAERTPKTNTVRTGWMRGHPFPLITEIDDRGAEFDRWLDSERARIWDEGYSHCFGLLENEVRSLDDNPYRSTP